MVVRIMQKFSGARETHRDEIIEKLSKLGLRILHHFSFPIDERRAIDIVAIYRDGKLLVKHSQKVSSKSTVFQELKRISKLLDINVLFIADQFNNEDVLDDVLYVRDRIGIVSTNTIRKLSEGRKIYIYEYNGMYYIKIDGEKLRRIRLERRYSLNELAKHVGVSVKALQKYEENEIDMSIEKAYRFLEIFGDDFEEVLSDIDIFSDRITKAEGYEEGIVLRRKENDKRYEIAQKLSKVVSRVEIFNTLPTDIIAKVNNFAKIFVAYISKNIDLNQASMKCRENRALAESFDGIALSVTNNDRERDVINEIERFTEVYPESAINDLIKEIAKNMHR